MLSSALSLLHDKQNSKTENMSTLTPITTRWIPKPTPPPLPPHLHWAPFERQTEFQNWEHVYFDPHNHKVNSQTHNLPPPPQHLHWAPFERQTEFQNWEHVYFDPHNHKVNSQTHNLPPPPPPALTLGPFWATNRIPKLRTCLLWPP